MKIKKTNFQNLLGIFLLSFIFLSSCQPTYKKETLKMSVKELALKEYDLDVEVEEAGKTLGVRFRVANLLSEMTSGEEDIYKKMNGLFTILARVALSSDADLSFVVLDVADESNPGLRLVFTRYVEDIKKSMAEALSQTQMQDRLLQEFVVNGKRVPFDPEEMDLVRLMMMMADAQDPEKSASLSSFKLEAVSFYTFVSRVGENTLRRLLRERRGIKQDLQVRDVDAEFSSPKEKKAQFKILLDLVSRPRVQWAPEFLEKTVLPLVASEMNVLFKSYRFDAFSGITVIEKNSGKVFSVSK